VLNLYSGIGGNRKLWENVEVTAVEYDPSISAIYKDYFPDDTMIIGDAHQYLLDHYKEYDFIWASPPCPTHSRIREMGVKIGLHEPLYPDMKLYQEVIFLDNFFDGKYCVENVKPYYDPLIKPSAKLGRHIFWSNFHITPKRFSGEAQPIIHVNASLPRYGFSIEGYKVNQRRDKIMRNLVNPEIGKHVLECAMGNTQIGMSKFLVGAEQ